MPSRFTPVQVLALDDLNGNGKAEVGALLTSDAEADRVLVKDSMTGTRISTLSAKREFAGFQLRQAEVLEGDRNANGAADVAMLYYDPAEGQTWVWVADALNNARLLNIRLPDPDYKPVQLLPLPDLNGDDAGELAVLLQASASGRVKAEVYATAAQGGGYARCGSVQSTNRWTWSCCACLAAYNSRCWVAGSTMAN